MPDSVKIAPSILSANFSCLGSELEKLSRAGADWIHIDVMDGHFVPNMTIGPQVIKDLRPCTDLPFDVHLMMSPVDYFIPLFADAGADHLIIHPEAGPHLHRSLQMIRALGKKAGVALNPGTSVDVLHCIRDMIDQVLVMTVNPGFGGQAFLHSQLEKIRMVREMTLEWNVEIVVDGGINNNTARSVIDAGATTLVAGTAIFSACDWSDAMNELRG